MWRFPIYKFRVTINEYHSTEIIDFSFYLPGVLYHRWGKFSEAVTAYKKSLSLDPTQKNAQQYLQTVQKKINRQM